MHSADKIRIAVLTDNHVALPRPLLGEWGLSLYIEVETGGRKYAVLYDTGQTGTALINNASVLGIDLSKVSHIILSHGHYDHTGGLKKLVEEAKTKPTIIAHPGIFDKKIVVRGGFLQYIGIPYPRSWVEENANLVLTRDFVEIVPGVYFSGEVLRYGYPEYTPDMYIVREDGRLIRDTMPDDAALIVNLRDRGLVIITGCGHAGILNIIEHAFTMTGVRKLYAIIGGLHQEREPPERVRELAERLAKLDVKVVLPLHCTGIRATNILAQVLGDKVVVGGVGTVLEL